MRGEGDGDLGLPTVAAACGFTRGVWLRGCRRGELTLAHSPVTRLTGVSKPLAILESDETEGPPLVVNELEGSFHQAYHTDGLR